MSRAMSGPYDFEFPTVPPAVCNRCGATVQKRDLHDEWHAALRPAAPAAEAADELRAARDYLNRLAETSTNPILLRAVAEVSRALDSEAGR